jgi:leucyl-tRNA synthetase
MFGTTRRQVQTNEQILRDLQISHRRLIEENQECAKDRKNLDALCAQRDRRIDSLESELEESRHTTQRLRDKVQGLELAQARLQERLKQADQHCERLDHLKQDYLRLQKDLESKTRECETQAAQITIFRDYSSRAASILVPQTPSLENELRGQLKRKEEECFELRHDLANARQEKSRAREETIRAGNETTRAKEETTSVREACQQATRDIEDQLNTSIQEVEVLRKEQEQSLGKMQRLLQKVSSLRPPRNGAKISFDDALAILSAVGGDHALLQTRLLGLTYLFFNLSVAAQRCNDRRGSWTQRQKPLSETVTSFPSRLRQAVEFAYSAGIDLIEQWSAVPKNARALATSNVNATSIPGLVTVDQAREVVPYLMDNEWKGLVVDGEGNCVNGRWCSSEPGLGESCGQHR